MAQTAEKAGSLLANGCCGVTVRIGYKTNINKDFLRFYPGAKLDAPDFAAPSPGRFASALSPVVNL